MRVLVTGASGFVGSALCPALVDHGVAVRAVSRKAGPAAMPEGVELFVHPDLNAATLPGRAFTGVDAVIHLAGLAAVPHRSLAAASERYREYNVGMTERLAEAAARAGVDRFIFISSTRVFGRAAPGCTDATPPAPDEPYGWSKLQAERALHALTGRFPINVVVMRAPPVYGPGVKGRFRQLLRLVASGVPIPVPSVSGSISLVYVHNLTAAIRATLTPGSKIASRRFDSYLVADADSMGLPDIIRALARGMGKHGMVLPVPAGLVSVALTLIGRKTAAARLIAGRTIDSSRFREQFEYTPPWSQHDGLVETGRWYAERAKLTRH